MKSVKGVLGAALLTIMLVVVVGLGVVSGGVGAVDASTGLLSGSVCATSGPLAGLPRAAAENARIIVATASSRGGDRAALVALMTGLAESNLLVLSNPHDPSGNKFLSQGVGYDHDSLGIFQQRPSWGSAAQRMDPVASTNLLLDRLLALPDWQSMPPWVSAQRVQVSASSDGSVYRAQLDRAHALLTRIQADAAVKDCAGSRLGQAPAGPIGAHGLPARYKVPAGTSLRARAAITFALAQLGKPYVWAATGPDSYDCSGLTQRAWSAGGVAISRTTLTQRRDGSPTTASALAPGDLILTPGSDGTLAAPGHVGMYLGDGLVVEAPHPGDSVKVVTYESFAAGGVSDLRHIA
ncbi:C40 family peptidase [Segeticoccus rhizosphaerae]|uniref:C40 family peptidase n=1 Tax=Segeticoccus rhizosphaerae TaxID=1104777 RepID=UPI001EEFC3CD|nr:NlpC/P60 family protein [Segeticoccus rhizosphaerae]